MFIFVPWILTYSQLRSNFTTSFFKYLRCFAVLTKGSLSFNNPLLYGWLSLFIHGLSLLWILELLRGKQISTALLIFCINRSYLLWQLGSARTSCHVSLTIHEPNSFQLLSLVSLLRTFSLWFHFPIAVLSTV